MRLLLHAAAQHIGYFGNRNKGVGVHFLDDGLHLGDLKTVDDKINQGLFLAGIISLGGKLGNSAAEGLRERFADRIGTGGNDGGRLGFVQAFDNEVHGFDGGAVGQNGVKGHDPAAEDAADGYIQQYIVNHHEGTYCHAQALGKDYSHDLHAVDGAAEADGHAAAHTGDQAAEDGTQQQIISGKGGGSGGREERVDGERGQGIDQDRPQRVDRKGQSLLFHAEKKQRRIEQNQKHRQGVRLRRQLPEEHGRTGDAAVIELYRGQKQCDADGVDDTGEKQKQKGLGPQGGQGAVQGLNCHVGTSFPSKDHIYHHYTGSGRKRIVYFC